MANPMLIVKGAKKGKKLLMPILGAVAGVITISVVASYLQSNLNSNNKDDATDKYLKDNHISNFNAPLKQSLLSKESDVELNIKTFDILNPVYHWKIKNDIIALKPIKISKIQGELLLDDKLERLDFYNLQSIDNLNNLPDIVKELSFYQSYTLNKNILTITYTLNNNSANYSLLKNTLTNFNSEATKMFLALIPNQLVFEYNIKQNKYLSNTDNNFLAYKNAYENELNEYTLSKQFLKSIDNSFNGNDIKIASDLDKDAMKKHLSTLSKKPNFHIFNNASNYEEIKNSFETNFLKVDNIKLSYVFDLINEPRNNLTDNQETELNKIINLDKNSLEYVKHYQRDNSLFYTLPFNIDLKKMLNEDRHPTSYDAIFLYAKDIANNKIKHFANTTEPDHSGKGWLEHYYRYYDNSTAGAWNGYINFSKYFGIGNTNDVLQAMFYKLYDLKNKWGVNEWRTKDNEATVKEYLKRTMLQFYTMLGHTDIQANFDNPALKIPSINDEIKKQNDKSTKNTDKPSFYNALIEAYKPFIIGSLLSNQSVETIINEIQKYTLNAYQNTLINKVKENYTDLKSLEEYKNDFADYFVNDVLSNPNNNDLTLECLEKKIIEYFSTDKFKPLYIYYNMVNNQNKLKEYISTNKINKNNEKSDLYKLILNINKNLDDAFKGFVNKKTNQFSFTDKHSYFAYKDDKVMIINKGVVLNKDISNDTLLLDNFNYSLNSKSAIYEYNSYYELARTSFEEIDEKLKTIKNNAFFLYSNNKKAITDLLEMLKFPKHQGSFELIEKQELSFYEYLYNLAYHYHYQTNENKYSGKEILSMIEKYIFKVANTYFASNELDLFNKQLYKNQTVNENEELIKDAEYLKVILNGLNYKDSDIKDTYYETLKTLYARQDFFYFNLPYSIYNDLINDKDIPTYKQEKLSLKDTAEAVLEEFNKHKSIFNDNNLKPFEIMLDFIDAEIRTILYKDLENIYNENDIDTKPLIDKLTNLKNNLQTTYGENINVETIQKYIDILNGDKTKFSKIINNASFNVKEQKALYLNNGYITAFNEKYRDINSNIYHTNKYLLNLFDTIEVSLTKDTITADNSVINQVINKLQNNWNSDITINGNNDNKTYSPYHYSVYNSGFITENIFKKEPATYQFANNQWLNKAEHWNGKGFDNAIQFLFSPIYVYWFRQGTKVQGTSIQTIFKNQNEWDALVENVIRDNTAIRYTPNDYFFGYKKYNNVGMLNLAIPWYLDFKDYDDKSTNKDNSLRVDIKELTYIIPN